MLGIWDIFTITFVKNVNIDMQTCKNRKVR